jgi:exopolysaccharide biosynthesis polyprenyl glycosylphosphotransferase
VLVDAASSLVGFAVGHSLIPWPIIRPVVEPVPPGHFAALFALFFLLLLTAFWRHGLYGTRASVLNLWEMSQTVKAFFISSAFYLALLFLLNIPGDRAAVLLSLAGSIALTVLSRRVVACVSRTRRLRQGTGRRVLVVGCGEMGRLVVKKILDAHHTDRTVVGFVDDTSPMATYVPLGNGATARTMDRCRVVGRTKDIETIVGDLDVDELLIDETTVGAEAVDEMFELTRRIDVAVGIVPRFADPGVDRLCLEDLGALPVLRPHPPTPRRAYRAAKRIFDLCGSLALLVLTAPLLILAYLALRMGSRGPVIFHQERIGQNGKPFRIYKFRTMDLDAAPYDYSPASDHDPRITRLGRILRTSGFDELPQLLNVFRGEMSLVGPRPEMAFIVDTYTELQRRRLEVKPGITGVWQLSPDRHAQIHENIEYDFYYIHHRSLLLDAMILVETVFATLGMLFRRIRQRWRGQDPIRAAGGAPSLVPSVGAGAGSRAVEERLAASDPRRE